MKWIEFKTKNEENSEEDIRRSRKSRIIWSGEFLVTKNITSTKPIIIRDHRLIEKQHEIGFSSSVDFFARSQYILFCFFRIGKLRIYQGIQSFNGEGNAQ